MVRDERVLRHHCGATNAPLRVNDCQFALGFENTNMRKNCRSPSRRLRLLSFLASVAFLADCAKWNSGQWCGMGTILAEYHQLR